MRLFWLTTGLLGIAAARIAAQPPAAPRVVIAETGIPAPPASLQQGTAPLTLPQIVLVEPQERAAPISLATALKLAGVKPLDIQLADQQVLIATAQLDRAKLLWVPNIVTGFDYFRHEGGQQNFAGEIVRSSRGSITAGVGPNVVVSLSDAIYAPLAAKQDLKARLAQRQTVENDTMLAVCEAYFSVQQARGELVGALIALQNAEAMDTKTEKLAEGLAPPLEANRAKVELARRKQTVAGQRERWRVASADLVRLLRLEPGSLVEPLEATHLPVTVIDSNSTLEALIPIALTNRPELVGHQAIVQATLARLEQEKIRPLIPSIALRSTSTNPSGSIGYGAFGGGPNDNLGSFGSRLDLDLQVMWEFQSLGLGNKARVAERKAEQMAATLELFRTQDRIAAEVSTAFAQARAASERMTHAEPALKQARELVDKSLQALGQTKRLGDTLVLLVRPQEVVAAVQLFAAANTDFYTAVGDYNRAQFRLYRALGHPANSLAGMRYGDARAAAIAAPPTMLPPVGDNAINVKTPDVVQASFARQRSTEPIDLPIMRKMLLSRPVIAVADAPLPVMPTPVPAAVPLATQPALEWTSSKQQR